MTSKHQTLMNAAYDRWHGLNNWSLQDFWDQLDANERIAVFTGNLNQQVTNGGFRQWHDNGYATDEVVGFLDRLLRRMNTETSRAVRYLIAGFVKIQQDLNDSDGSDDACEDFSAQEDVYCGEYYAINERFLAEIEALL